MSVRTVDVAASCLDELVALAESGETITIAKLGKPVAQIVPLPAEPPVVRRRLGLLAGQFTVPDDIDTMFADEIEDMFYGPKEA